MAPHTAIRFHPQVSQIGTYWEGGGHTELYLFEGDRLAIVDTGCINTPQEYIAPALEDLGYSLKDVQVIINTHGHFDHAGGNANLVAASGAAVWLPSGDVEMAADLDRQFALCFAHNSTLLGRTDQVEAAKATFKKAALPSKVDRALADGEVLDLGRAIELQVIPAKGHTAGSIALYWEREGMLIAGDEVIGLGSRPGGLPLIYFAEEYEQTLDRLAQLDVNVMGIGHHYRTLTLGRDSLRWGRAGKKFMAESRQIAEIIRDAVAETMAGHRDLPFLPAARGALARCGERLGVQIDPATGVPVGAWPTGSPLAPLVSNWRRFGSAAS